MSETKAGAKGFFQKVIKLQREERLKEVKNTIPQDIPLVTVFGSCRIHNPLKILALNNYIKFNNRLLAYCHTTHAIIQQINLIQNSTS
jgi:hypothetical protein